LVQTSVGVGGEDGRGYRNIYKTPRGPNDKDFDPPGVYFKSNTFLQQCYVQSFLGVPTNFKPLLDPFGGFRIETAAV
jgi:hypothetical protein